MATPKATKNKTFMVSFTFKLDVGVDVVAETMEAALEKARAMSVPDIIDMTGVEYNDSSDFKVSGIWQRD